MRGSAYAWPGMTPAEEKAAIAEESKVLKRARIMNGKEPGYENGHPKRQISVAGK
jgi:hypothetical protein